jgi:nitrite reductase/ring-hydroxylating ferredoxin subunit
MSKLIALGSLLIITMLAFVACSNGGTSGTKIKASWIAPQNTGDTVSISASEIETNTIVHFRANTSEGNLAFMAFKIDSTTYVRSNICPPCRSTGFSLQGSTLVCDSCGTTFNAQNGAGVAGACKAYPKASVPYTTASNNLVMTKANLVAAHQATVTPGA